jgi:tetratricopeptide (TPR) repeat protein
MKSPFKFLDAYTLDDRRAFFGREEEVAALYDMVTKNRLILVYGQSGTGKTSLLQCGLASRFDTTDWLPLAVRRQFDINRALDLRLAQALGQPNIESPAAALEALYETFLRPVYLIFDQLEEMFILGTPPEQELFVQRIRALLDSPTPCRILFVMREEYLAYLYGFEKVIPTLFDRRLRVEPMGMAKVQAMLTGSFRQFNIQAEPPETEILTEIIDNVSGGRAGIQLPYLQVYLDTLYREDFARTYPGQTPQPGAWLPVAISRAEVRSLGKIENVLEKFLREQQERLQADLEKKFPGTGPESVKKVLDAFVSEEGTKRPVGYERRADGLQLEPRVAEWLQPLPAAAIDYACQSLEQARLLRFDDRHIELAHDALAALVDSQRSTQQRRLNDALNRLLGSHREHRATGEYLTRRQLNSLEDVLPALEARLQPEVRAFVRQSYARAEAAELAELVAERQKRIQARRVAIGGVTLAVAALLGLAVAVQQYQAANRAKIEIARNAAAAQRNVAMALKVEGKYGEAVAQLAGIEQFADALPPGEKQKIVSLRSQWQQQGTLVAKGDSLTQAGYLREAIEQYEAAQHIAPDAHLDNLVVQTRKDLETELAQLRRSGEVLMNAKRYALAAQDFERALRLSPEDAVLRQKLEECRAAQ